MKFEDIFRRWHAVEEYPAGAVIYSERDPAEALYYILAGEVQLTLRGIPLSNEVEGGIIGETAIVSPARRTATATASTVVRLARLSDADFQQVAARNPAFSLHVMRTLASRLRAVDGFITSQFEKPARKKKK